MHASLRFASRRRSWAAVGRFVLCEINMNCEELIQQYHGATLPKLVEKQIKSLNEDALLQAIRGIYDHFPAEFCPQVDPFTLNYAAKNWFGPHIVTADLGDVFSDTIKDIKNMATQFGVPLSDDQIFDMFNLIAMRLSYFAHSRPELRTRLGIKKGWFS